MRRFCVSVVAAKSGFVVVRHAAAALDLIDDQFAGILGIAGRMGGGRDFDTLVDEPLGLCGTDLIRAGSGGGLNGSARNTADRIKIALR